MILKQSHDSPHLLCLTERVSDIPTHDWGRRGHVPGPEDPSPWQSASGPTHRWVSLNTPVLSLSGAFTLWGIGPRTHLQELPLPVREAVKHAGRCRESSKLQGDARVQGGYQDRNKVTLRGLFWDLYFPDLVPLL